MTALIAANRTTARGEVRTGIRKNGTTNVPQMAPRVLAPRSSPALAPTLSSESDTSMELIGKTMPMTRVAGATTMTRLTARPGVPKKCVSTPRVARTSTARPSSASPRTATG